MARQADTVELSSRDSIQQRGAIAKFVARQREQPTLGRAADRVPRAADTLQERGDRARGAELADEVDIADVDPELERCGRDQRTQLAALEPLLGVEPMLTRQAAMVRGDVLRSKPFGQMSSRALGEAACVDEDQRRAVLADQHREPVVDLLPDFVRHDRFERHRGQLDGEIAMPHMAGVDDRAGRRTGSVDALADEEAGDLLDRLLRRRQPDAHEFAGRAPVAFGFAVNQGLQALERQRQVRAALVRSDGMDLVDDHGAGRCQHLAARRTGHQDVQGFRRRHDDVRRAFAHADAFGLWRVAGADGAADAGGRQAQAFELRADTGERHLEIALDVVRQRLQWRDVDDARLVGQRPCGGLAHERVDRSEERGQRLARTGRCGDQDVATRLDGRPCIDLRGGRAGERRVEPGPNGRVERIQNAAHHHALRHFIGIAVARSTATAVTLFFGDPSITRSE